MGPLVVVTCVRPACETRIVELVQIEGEENMENAEGFMSGSDEFKEGDSGCQHDQHAPPPRSLGSVLTKEQAIQVLYVLRARLTIFHTLAKSYHSGN